VVDQHDARRKFQADDLELIAVDPGVVRDIGPPAMTTPDTPDRSPLTATSPDPSS
jgi:hypothetical protein